MERLALITLSLIFSPVEGHFKVIGSPSPIIAAPGDDAILPCHVEPLFNVARFTVEWSRPDLHPDPRDKQQQVEYVHVYRDTREVLDMKLPSYMRRTSLFADGLRHGNISLKISNVTVADEGRYKCFIPKLKSHTQSSIVLLVVEPNRWTTETPLQTTSLQTPDLMDNKDRKGVLWITTVFSLVLIASVCLTVKYRKEKCVKASGYINSRC